MSFRFPGPVSMVEQVGEKSRPHACWPAAQQEAMGRERATPFLAARRNLRNFV